MFNFQPYIVANNLHRVKLDANRDVGEAAHGDPIAMEAWENFHNFTADAQGLMEAQFGTVYTT